MPASAKVPVLILIVCIVIAVLVWAGYRKFFDSYHLATVQSGVLYRDGVRDAEQFARAVQQTHVKTVVCLVDDNEMRQSPFVEEARYCSDHNIDLIRLPITLGGWPSDEQIQQFLELTADSTKQPVLVHCAQGVRRTGMMAAAFQMSVLKLDKSQAESGILRFGHSDRTVNDVRRFIETYNPDSRTMSEQLPMSQE